MSLTHNQDVVEAFAPDASEQPFADGIRAWCFDWCSQYLDARSTGNHVEVRTKFRIIVADEILR